MAWQWDFGNGTGSAEPQPVTRFKEPGRYAVTLTVRSKPGCASQTTRTITVVRRDARPLVGDHDVLPGDTVAVRASNPNQEAEALRLYPNPTAGQVRLENPRWDRPTVQLRLLTLRGQELGNRSRFYEGFSISVNLHQLAGEPLPAGVYLLHVRRGDRVFIRRVMVR